MANEWDAIYFGIDVDGDNAAFDGVFFVDNQYYGSIAFALHKEDIAFVGYNTFHNEYTTTEK
jgi:hypothetical protein